MDYYEKNRDKVLQKTKEYYKKYRDEQRQKQREYYLRTRGKEKKEKSTIIFHGPSLIKFD